MSLVHILGFVCGFAVFRLLLCLCTWGLSLNLLPVGCCRFWIPLALLDFHCLVTRFSCHLFRPMLGVGIRYGEADNPGPVNRVGLCVTNPTCVSNKFDVYVDLLTKHQLHLVSMSETAATSAAQRQLDKQFRSKKCKILWCPPVPPLCDTRSGLTHARGRASGVSLLSKLPCRHSRLHSAPEWSFTTRFVHVIVQVGHSHFQLVVLYCKPVHSASDTDYNSQLMQFALGQLRLLPLPFVILGDFNMPVSHFESWPELLASGCQDLTDLHLQHFGFVMPPTCKGVTNPDNAIISAGLIPFVKNIQVLEPTWFSAHCPVIFDLLLPGDTLFMHRLSFPRSFVELDLEDDAFNAVDTSSCFEQVTSLEDWGIAVEQAVNLALSAGQGSRPSLSKAFKGRCRPMKVTKRPVCSSCKPACPGSYEPSTEVLTMASRRQVTQTRRLESLYRRLCKLGDNWSFATLPLATQQQLREEWLAIVRSHAFGLPFLHWIASFADMDYPGFPIPCAAWVFEAYQLAKHFLECTLQENAKVQKAKAAFSRASDRLANDKQAFAAVRGPGPPPVLQTCTHVAFPVIVVTRNGGFLRDVFADVSDLSKLSGAFPILLGDHPSGLVEAADHFITVSTVSSLDLTDQVGSLTQDQYATAPDEVAADLTQFWQAIWHKQDPPAPFVHAQPGEFGLDMS